MEDSDIQDEKEGSGFNLGGFIRDRLLLKAIFGDGDEDQASAPVIQIDSGSVPTGEEEGSETPKDEVPPEDTAEQPAEEVPAR